MDTPLSLLWEVYQTGGWHETEYDGWTHTLCSYCHAQDNHNHDKDCLINRIKPFIQYRLDAIHAAEVEAAHKEALLEEEKRERKQALRRKREAEGAECDICGKVVGHLVQHQSTSKKCQKKKQLKQTLNKVMDEHQ